MKPILINKTLTTIALLSTIQCGYGTGTTEEDAIELSSWDNIVGNSQEKANNPDYNGGVYTLIAPESGTGTKYYKIETNGSPIEFTNELVIPGNVSVPNKYIINNYA